MRVDIERATSRERIAEQIYEVLLAGQRDAGDAALCDALALLAENSGRNVFRHAAQIVRGAKSGRPTIDDVAALARIATYPVTRRREAVAIVARQVAGSEASRKTVDAVAHRLRRKIKRTKWMCPPAPSRISET